ncbi:hypothetical protein [Exiguobacterium sp. AT1b]|uniref:Uncharacterized protein n=1 Tax=Exiguobacterium sp. (strain ATCC BAA-1283 / AT1b) TaxID=360911 RepID=C4L6S7_EXISA|nr:hypothetical protein [Exiguobacterium sp. AT1b]ACQ70020.1 hypothetical protein EAT1b_1092 [Exiguobacterium sp. AT1b]
MITQPFKQAVTQKDLERVKIMLSSSLILDLTFKSFQEMLAYALNQIPELIEQHDGTQFPNMSVWTKTYASEVREDLIDNFSAERIEHIKNVHEHVYAQELQEQLNSSTAATKDVKHEVSSVNITLLIVTLGVAVASILVGVLMDLSIVTIATTTVISTLLVGGITYYVVQKQ